MSKVLEMGGRGPLQVKLTVTVPSEVEESHGKLEGRDNFEYRSIAGKLLLNLIFNLRV
jgi:hypothetical protein